MVTDPLTNPFNRNHFKIENRKSDIGLIESAHSLIPKFPVWINLLQDSPFALYQKKFQEIEVSRKRLDEQAQLTKQLPIVPLTFCHVIDSSNK